MEAERLDTLLAHVITQAKALKIPVSPNIDPHVEISARNVRRFGLCARRGEGFVIQISKRMLVTTEDKVCQTLAHEVLHTCPQCGNHGKLWKAYVQRMNRAYGYRIQRTNEAEELGAAPILARYLCEKCGAEILRMRKCSLVEHPEWYHCRCGGRLKLVK